MRCLIKFSFSAEVGNDALRDPDFGAKVQEFLSDVQAEAAYFTAVDGRRGGYIVVNLDDASQIPAMAEPLFLWLDAEVEFIPVMVVEDLAKAGPAIEAAVQKWG